MNYSPNPSPALRDKFYKGEDIPLLFYIVLRVVGGEEGWEE